MLNDPDNEEIEEEEWEVQARVFKEQGDEAFRKGDFEAAITYFSQAIAIDPDNHILYSNRSAAYMRADSKSKALHDAEKCVSLAPDWVKGYNRLGIALQSLKRFDAAMDSFKKGIELDPNNQSLWGALRFCQEAYEQDKQQRFKAAALEREEEERRINRREEIKKEMLREKEQVQKEDLLSEFLAEVAPPASFSSSSGGVAASSSSAAYEAKAAVDNEDDLLASFFTEIVKPAPSKNPVVINEDGTTVTNEDEEAKEEKVMNEKYTKQNLGTGKEQVERLLCKHYQWRNLNPFYVLDLDSDATEEDIKFRYKKLSLKVHPDRLRDVEDARLAFEEVKEAYAKLLDPDQRRNLVMHIENVTTELKKERRKQLSKGKSENDLQPFEDQRRVAIMKHFADMEQMRILSEKNKRVYSAREKMQETEEENKMSRFAEFDKDWSEENRRDKRVGNWREFQHDPSAKRVKEKHYKEEVREEKKHGVVQIEGWRKSWK